MIIFVSGAVSLAFLVCCAGLWAKTPSKGHAKAPSYATVQPIIQSKCVSCHSDKEHPEDVNLSSYEKLMKSGEHGSIVVPGHPEKSQLVLYINGQKQPRMPFRQPPLSSKDISLISAWVKAGAHK
jgi:uncharacterized membrane protein